MKSRISGPLCLVAIAMSLSVLATARGLADDLEYENPYDLPVIGEVQDAGSDARAQHFQQNVLPAFETFINDNLQEMSEFENAGEFVLDPTRLYLPLNTEKPIRAYFMHEGAQYRNQLGLSIVNAGHGQNGTNELVDPLENGKLVFPDASFENPPDGLSPGGPLNKGDFVEIGHVEQGMQLDFFLISDGARDSSSDGGDDVLRNFPELNSDRKQHVIAAYFRDQYPGFVLIGFEDIVGGGDLDYNDCLFVIDVGYDFSVEEGDLPH